MDQWAFLTPFIDALAPHIFIPMTNPCRIHAEDASASSAFSIVPRAKCMTLCFSDTLMAMTHTCRPRAVATLRTAMVVVARALWIDARVWSLLKCKPREREDSRRPSWIDHRLFRMEDFSPSFVLYNGPCTCQTPRPHGCGCIRLRAWLLVLEELLGDTHDPDGEVEATEDAVLATALQSLRALEIASRGSTTATTTTTNSMSDHASNRTVPLVLRLESDHLEANTLPLVISTLATLSRTRWVHPARASHTIAHGESLFQWTGLRLHRWGFDELSSEQLTHIQTLGFSIESVDIGPRPVGSGGSTLATQCLQTLAEAGSCHQFSLSMHVNQQDPPRQSFGERYAVLQAASMAVPRLVVHMPLTLRHTFVPLLVRLIHDTWPRRRPRQDSSGATQPLRALEIMVSDIESFSAQEWLSPRAAAPLITTTRQRVVVDSSTTAGAALLRRVMDLSAAVEPKMRMKVDEHTEMELVHVGSCGHFLIHPSGRVVDVPDRSAVRVVPRGEDGRSQGTATIADTANATAHGLDVLRCTVGDCRGPGTVAQLLLLLLHADFSRLRSLELRIVAGDQRFTSESLATILRMYNRLEALKLRGTSLTSLDVVVDAVRDGQCSRLRVLSLDAGHVGFVPFFMALADPEFPLSKTLKELKFHYVHDHDEDEDDDENDGAGEYLRGLETMLTYNTVLQFLELVLVRTRQKTTDRVTAALRGFHGVPLAATNPRLQMSMRCKAALVSVCDNVGYLGNDVWTLVLQFAAPSLVRIVHVKHVRRAPGNRTWVPRGLPADGDYIEWFQDKLVSFTPPMSETENAKQSL